MPISTVVPTPHGGAVGWDGQSWVPVDPNVLSGGTLSNLARGASLGIQQIGQGISQAFSPDDPNVQQAGQILQQQTEAASNAAPYSIAAGMGVPEVAGGIATAIATQGMGIPAIIGAQALTGGAIGALRPGDPSQRVVNALWGSVLAGGGEGLGIAAMQGIGAAMRIGKVVADDSVASTAQGVINGIAKQQNAEAAAAAAPALTEGGSADQAAQAAIESGGGPKPQPTAGGADISQPGSAGAAVTPPSNIDPVTAAEYSAMDQMDKTGAANPTTSGTNQIIEDAKDLGHKPAWWSGAEKDSQARVLGAIGEFDPRASAGEFARKEGNQMLRNRAAAMATGMSDTLDPQVNTITRMDPLTMQTLREQLNAKQENLINNTPAIQGQKILNVVRDVDVTPGFSPTVGKAWNDYQSGIMDMLGKNPNQLIPPQGFINTMREMTANSAEAAKYGDYNSVEAFQEAINRLYNLVEKETKASAGGDASVTGRGWAQLRKQEQMYRILNRPGVIDGMGNVNTQSLYRGMKAEPRNGGFGIFGPGVGTAQEPLWKLTLGQLQENLAGTVPPTGARILGALGGLTRSTMRSTAGKVVGGGIGAKVLESIWSEKK